MDDPFIAFVVIACLVVVLIAALIASFSREGNGPRRLYDPRQTNIQSLASKAISTAECNASLSLQYTDEIPVTVEVLSSDKSKVYEVNLREQTCTCADWMSIRPGYPKNHFRRICRHLREAIVEEMKPHGFSGTVLREIHFGIGPHDHYYAFSVERNQEVFAFRSGVRPWCDVVALDRHSHYKKFGFNLEENRWSYHESPSNSPAVKERIKAWASVVSGSV